MIRLRAPRTSAAAAYQAAGRPPARTPWRDAGWCALDLELTGLDPAQDHIIAVGMVPIEGGRAQLGAAVYTLVHSPRRSQLGAILTHKLRTADVQHAPTVDDAMDLTLRTLAGRVPVFHAAAVERAFLQPHFKRLRLAPPAAADTEALGLTWLRASRREPPPSSQRALALAELARRLGQPAHPAHHALGDALTTAQAFIALASLLDADSPQTVGTLLTLSER